MGSATIPDDFPRELAPSTVGGYRPKVLLRRTGDQLVSGLTDEELSNRYDACEDLARQLASYVRRKRAENPLQSLRDALSKVESDVTGKVSSGQWDVSSAEIIWIMKRVRALLVEQVSDDCPQNTSDNS
ncbi:TPA: hypothetical protein QDB24_006511 [Burkholderia vietnamiensis]|uniref:hypothetical protein n=1 Tax=Burkholderia cepacia complex TaxID=87882 RepID=UPI001B91D4D3|nr:MULTISPECIES: hypothetical protein [Burkholderia cepacia complex]MBR7914063.1 hypothetical protein [Burkholderia vietnamiensis]HDR8918337.1 hypothetical protein [Burkholderia vietnamiensis]HDR8976635.1 hypothetical protein [Burkholderia vietnamiensis]HDR9067143.1 hypothetical protein [Burkholderia vietnamiensis]HDR9278336.1 hypothetical protein [Burkholderia vietnamiensis]